MFAQLSDSSIKNDFYTAAVVEFAPPIASDSTHGNIEEALTQYLRLINEAAEKKADIVIFPEHALNFYGITTRKSLEKYAVELNDSQIYNSTSFDNVCDYSSGSKSNKVLNLRLKVIVTVSWRLLLSGIFRSFQRSRLLLERTEFMCS